MHIAFVRQGPRRGRIARYDYPLNATSRWRFNINAVVNGKIIRYLDYSFLSRFRFVDS